MTEDATLLWSAIHPVFAEALQPFVDAHKTIRMSTYETALKAHDWTFQYSDDQRVWCRGVLQLRWLECEAREIDAEFAVWNRIAPTDFQRVETTINGAAQVPQSASSRDAIRHRPMRRHSLLLPHPSSKAPHMNEKVYGLMFMQPSQKGPIKAHCYGDCGKISMSGMICDDHLGGIAICFEEACPYLDKQMEEPLGTTTFYHWRGDTVYDVYLRTVKP